ncbi:MAG: glycosyltransferase family 2 protein [Pseudomonadota bacterium]
MPDISIVIRTLNEAKFLGECLDAIAAQELGDLTMEVVLIDSGSTDGTVELARSKGARITHIDKSEFTFGRSLNRGCAFSDGDILVLLSGHCVPVGTDWLARLVAPLRNGTASYAYGGQVGRQGVTKFSEHQLFAKYFPPEDRLPQEGFFCNNANSAILRSAWEADPFDETITGLEDMALAKVITGKGGKIAYVGSAAVEHLHEETWRKVRIRFEREAIALQGIMPDVHVRFSDFLRYTMSGILTDWGIALSNGQFRREAWSIVAFRSCQFWGAWRGNAATRELSRSRKEAYFYPR